MLRRLLLLCALALAASLLGASGARAAVPDLWSGSWPSQLMPSGDEVGTLTWKPAPQEWAKAIVGEPWGGLPFAGCAGVPDARYFLGSYPTGGKLIACTTTPDGTALAGRYDGKGGEFSPGSFTIHIESDDSHQFEGEYFEDTGLTVEWCGMVIPESIPDRVAPSIVALPSSGRAGRVVRLRFSASDDRGQVAVRVSVMRGSKKIASVFSSLRRRGGNGSLVWHAPKRLHGTFTLVAQAFDAAGNASASSTSTLVLR